MAFEHEKNIFAIPANFQCLCTIIKNTSAVPRFLLVPFHGTTIGPGEQYVFVGSLLDWLQRKRYRVRDSVLAAFDGSGSPTFTIVQLPNVHVFDTNTSTTKMLAIDGVGAVVTANPCWA